jgi:hypothetical protein
MPIVKLFPLNNQLNLPSIKFDNEYKLIKFNRFNRSSMTSILNKMKQSEKLGNLRRGSTSRLSESVIGDHSVEGCIS